jgi:hypothetical protein
LQKRLEYKYQGDDSGGYTWYRYPSDRLVSDTVTTDECLPGFPGFVCGGNIPQCFTKELFQLMVIPSSVLGGVLVMGILSVVRMDVVIC